MSSLRHKAATPYLFLLPALAVLGVFYVYSMGRVVYLSMTRYTAFVGPDFIGLDNYATVLSSGQFWICVANSFAYLLVTPVLIAVSLGAALLVDSGLRGSNTLRLLLFIPVVTPTIVAAVAWRLVFAEDEGLVNSGLRALGFEGIRWLTERPWTLVTAMTVTLWKGFGFYMMVFVAGLLAVPRELREAAMIDGASRLGVFRLVVLPAIWPSIILVFLISSISALKVFDELFVTVKGVPIEHQTIVPLVYEYAFGRGNFGIASAMGIVLFVIILAFSMVHLRLARKGEQEAAR